MRLIDADALIPIMKYTTTDNEIGVFPIRIGFDAIKGVIDESPTIDAVEVVRCKDCKHFELDHFDRIGDIPLITAHEICTKWSGGCKTSKDGFCFMGERKNNAVEESEAKE